MIGKIGYFPFRPLVNFVMVLFIRTSQFPEEKRLERVAIEPKSFALQVFCSSHLTIPTFLLKCL